MLITSIEAFPEGLPDHDHSTHEEPNKGAFPADEGGPHEKHHVPTLEWSSIFTFVARRYHHLRTATPRSISKIRHGKGGHDHLNLRNSTGTRVADVHDVCFNFPDPTWCYSQELGLLVYQLHRDDMVKHMPRAHVYPWRLRDLETGEDIEVAFPHNHERMVRRVRCAEGVLMFEWCLTEPANQPRASHDSPWQYRHYATALDIVRLPTSTAAASARWDTVARAEWYVCTLSWGFRFEHHLISTHTASHYAAFMWADYSPGHGTVVVWNFASATAPSRVIGSLSPDALEFYGVRQRWPLRLRRLGLDARNLFFIEEEHRWEPGSHRRPLPRAHLVRSTGLPIIPGPVEAPLSSPGDSGEQPAAERTEVVQGPRWLDECGANGDVHLPLCTRCSENNTVSACTESTPIFRHTQTTTPFSLQTACAYDGSPGIWNGSRPATRTPTFAQEIGSALNAPAVRWPGWAPCWRHEDFPYLAVSEMVDFKADVRIVARKCAMLQTVSVHARPRLSVRMPRVIGSPDAPPRTRCEAVRREEEEQEENSEEIAEDWESEEGTGDDEFLFADDMWEQLLGAGVICGDERWVIGENVRKYDNRVIGGGIITIAKF